MVHPEDLLQLPKGLLEDPVPRVQVLRVQVLRVLVPQRTRYWKTGVMMMGRKMEVQMRWT